MTQTPAPANSSNQSALVNRTNVRTIVRDIKLLGENIYWAEIKVCGGAGQLAKVDVQDFAPPDSVLEVWRHTKSKKKAPQIGLFEDL